MESVTKVVTLEQAQIILRNAGAQKVKEGVYKNAQEVYFAISPAGSGRVKMQVTKGSCAC